MHLTRASTALLSTWLLLSGCTRGPSVEPTPPTHSTPPPAKAEVERFKKAGLTAPVAALSQADTGDVDLTELRDSVADPQEITEEQVAALEACAPPQVR